MYFSWFLYYCTTVLYYRRKSKMLDWHRVYTLHESSVRVGGRMDTETLLGKSIVPRWRLPGAIQCIVASVSSVTLSVCIQRPSISAETPLVAAAAAAAAVEQWFLRRSRCRTNYSLMGNEPLRVCIAFAYCFLHRSFHRVIRKEVNK